LLDTQRPVIDANPSLLITTPAPDSRRAARADNGVDGTIGEVVGEPAHALERPAAGHGAIWYGMSHQVEENV
jgi:hypothetical protein